jgi:cell division septation protein DedD
VSDTSRRLADDGFHEIQLTGKQVVFLFMAATVVSVVIFLCGVLVGRGVQAQRAAEADSTTEAATATGPPASRPASGADLRWGTDAPTEASAPVKKDDITYPERLATDTPPEETVARKPEAPVAAETKTATSAPKPDPGSSDQAPAAEAARPPASAPTGGWVVQVAALTDRTAALAIVKRLTDKGYPAFVVDPAPSDAARLHRVRVGPYADRAEADGVLRRLEREEKFQPLITR